MRKILLFINMLFCTIVSSMVFASTVNFYEKPVVDSKIIAVAQSGDQLLPIFYPKEKEWVKVANPKNGDVGWVKASELRGPVVITKVNGSEVQRQITVDDGKKPISYSIIQYSGPREFKTEDAQKIASNIEKENENMRLSVQKIQERMQNDIRTMFQEFQGFDKQFFTFPVIQPVIVVPYNAVANQTEKQEIKQEVNKTEKPGANKTEKPAK